MQKFSNFWRSLDLILNNCEIKLDLLWSRNYLNFEISRTATVATDPNANPPVQPARATEINSATFLYLALNFM